MPDLGDGVEDGEMRGVSGYGGIVYRYVSEAAGDHPPLDEVLAAAAQATKG